jgi:glutaredoxin
MTILMYSTTTCTTCNGLGSWLNQSGFEYTKKMADADPAVMAEFMAISDGMIGVPFTVITDDTGQQIKISGYDRKAFKKALNI